MSMRHDKTLIGNLAAWRDLSPAEQSAIQEHAADCPSCSKRLKVYEQQDRLLAGMPDLSSRVTFADVRDRIAISRASFAPQRAWAVIFALLLFLGLGAGAVAASGDALPGDLLYPLKRSVEGSRIWIAPDYVAREELAARFAGQRRIEVQALLSLNRSAVMDIEGALTDVRGNDWTLSGLRVTVPPALWPGEPPAVGQRIEMHIEIKEQAVRALAVRLTPRDGLSGGPGQPDLGNGTSPAEPGHSVPEPSAIPRGATPSDAPAATMERLGRTQVPEPTDTPGQSGTATQVAGAPSGPVVTPEAGGFATETVAPGAQQGPTGSPEPGPASPIQTPTGPQSGHPGGGGR
jgi:hypothetical protein